MADEVILYDLPSKSGGCWSLNPWKTRLVLNYKGIPYKTQWVEYPDVAPLLKGFGIPPNKEGRPYTIPAAKLDSNTYIMDSLAITKELEKRYPTPSLHLDSPILPKAMQALGKVAEGTRPVWMAKVPAALLNPPSAEYFLRTRSEQVGQPLLEYGKEKGGDQAWNNAEPAIKDLVALLKETDGPFFMGNEISYADFVITSALYFIRRIDEADYEKIVSHDESLVKLMDATAKYFERSDH
ncbi:hypothetical protein NA57DRAFT_57446 [Rhizodiscina lignyota]|uniref:GST N-terminal domain-containing protein n=1 Tax=Rhizodiscina lignyota TaxID=1504668 RepID=A0A9P4IB13_9PEZI|nr:hypothetical protein NA57DRAFT_57446 [Rhizodiscina lignyota]